MRFDYFENIWNQYLNFFESIKIDKEILKQIYHYNMETLIPNKSQILTDGTNGQEYEIKIVDYKDDGTLKQTLVIEPTGGKVECYKRFAFNEDFVKKGNINLKCYDSKTLDFLADNDYLTTFDAIRIDKQLKNLHILPDFEIAATSKLALSADLLPFVGEDSDIISDSNALNFRLEKDGEPYDSFLKSCEVNKVYSKFQQVKSDINLPELLNGKTK